MSLEVFRINHELKLVTRVRSKVEAKFQNTAGVEIKFYKNELLPENLIGTGTSNHKGEVYLSIPLTGLPDTFHAITFLSAVQNHPDFEDVSETVTALPSRMTMDLVEEDSVRMVKIFAGYPDETGQILPLADVELKIFIQREFGLLEVTEAQTTDAEGLVSMEFPDSLRGDENGNVTIVAKIADNETVGNVEISRMINWGVPLKVNDFYVQRELWSARANSPISLIIVVNAALLLIWGMIAFIFLEIFRINRIGKTN